MGYEKPVKEGEIIDVTIESVGEKGDGIAKVNNFVIIVPNAKEGDQVKIKIVRVLKKMAFAEITNEESTTEQPAEESSEDNSEESFEEEDSSSNEEE